jgi:hypothetical protein
VGASSSTGAAHYETFIQRLLFESQGSKPLKIIGSSATIEAFGRQVEHLYGRKATEVFPGPGPSLRESFYTQTLDYPQRLYVGLMPHNKTIFNAILEVIELLHREVQVLQRLSSDSTNPYGGTLQPGSDRWHELLDFYSTSVTYFLRVRDLDSIRTDIHAVRRAVLG